MINRAINLLETSYNRFLMKEINQDKLCKNIKNALEVMPFGNKKKEFEVQISNKNMSERFFGMRVFPDIDAMDRFCKDIVDSMESGKNAKFNDITKRWKSIDKWVLELDYILFDRNTINFTPKELVALTLHEIGHVIYSDKPIEGFYRAYKETKIRIDNANRGVQKLMYQIYSIPLAVACMQRRWVNDKNEIEVEMIADKTVADLGYGEYLVEAFNKIIRQYGSLNFNKNQLQAEIESDIDWCNKNIMSITQRKEKLKDELYYRAIKSKSNYVKALTIIILDNLGFRLKERYTGAVVENCIELLCDRQLTTKYEPIVDALESAKFDARLEQMKKCTDDVAVESFFNKRKKIKVELPSQYEIDAISIEVDKITNHHDRVFVLDLIYEVLERINNFEEVISADPSLVRRWSGKIDTMKEQLEQLRQATLAKKTFATKYKFFVKLPEEAADYEG